MQGSGPAIARCATDRAYGQRLAPPSLGSRPVGEVLGIAPSPLPLFPHPRPESAAEPRCQTFPPRRRLAFPEVAEPAAPVGGGFSHPLGETEASGSARPFPNPLLAAGAGLGGDAPPGCSLPRKAKSEKLPLPRSGHGALRRVYLELAAGRDQARNPLPPSRSRSFAADIEVAILGRADEVLTAPLSLPVQFVPHPVGK